MSGASRKGRKMFHKVEKVKALPGYNLLVSFAAGEQKRYSVAPLFDKWEVFRALSSVAGLFEQVHVDAGGYGIAWNDELDLSCNELWENGSEPEGKECGPCIG